MVFHQHDNSASYAETMAYNRAFFIATVCNGLFVIIQFLYAHWANSTSLLADAVHNLGDVLSLILAGMANRLSLRPPTERSTYGFKKTTILASLANGVLLIFTCGVIASEAIYKLFLPSSIEAIDVMAVASIGIVVNGLSALLFRHGRADLNIRGAFLHLLYDAFISIGVVLSAAILYWTNWLWVDPIIGLIIAIIIIRGTWSLFTDSFRLIVDGVPRDVSIKEVRLFLANQQDVADVHDLHVWALSTKETALSAHLWMPNRGLDDTKLFALSHQLQTDFNIHHVTIQVEHTPCHGQERCQTV